jgi:hypothetical protein
MVFKNHGLFKPWFVQWEYYIDLIRIKNTNIIKLYFTFVDPISEWNYKCNVVLLDPNDSQTSKLRVS